MEIKRDEIVGLIQSPRSFAIAKADIFPVLALIFGFRELTRIF